MCFGVESVFFRGYVCFLVCLGVCLGIESGCSSVFRCVFGCVCVCVIYFVFSGFCNNCRFFYFFRPKIFRINLVECVFAILLGKYLS